MGIPLVIKDASRLWPWIQYHVWKAAPDQGFGARGAYAYSIIDHLCHAGAPYGTSTTSDKQEICHTGGRMGDAADISLMAVQRQSSKRPNQYLEESWPTPKRENDTGPGYFLNEKCERYMLQGSEEHANSGRGSIKPRQLHRKYQWGRGYSTHFSITRPLPLCKIWSDSSGEAMGHQPWHQHAYYIHWHGLYPPKAEYCTNNRLGGCSQHFRSVGSVIGGYIGDTRRKPCGLWDLDDHR